MDLYMCIRIHRHVTGFYKTMDVKENKEKERFERISEITPKLFSNKHDFGYKKNLFQVQSRGAGKVLKPRVYWWLMSHSLHFTHPGDTIC